MAATDGITDSTDWLPTPLAALSPLEASLRCQVCKDFFTTPMMTSCSHTFCSLCIRRYLSQEGKCPACREQDQEIKLRRNWVVEELVTNFVHSRPGLLQFAHKSNLNTRNVDDENERTKKRRKVSKEPPVNSVERRSTRSQSKRISSHASQPSVTSTQEEIADSDEDEGSIYADQPISVSVPPLDDGLVGCPSCSRRMKEALINTHLDRCLNGTATPPSSSPQPPHIRAGTIAYNQTKPSSSSRLPTINYSLLNESKMRAKLRELGIPNQGSRELMSKRHTEWVNLWNANCDSLNQVSKRDLLKNLEIWERTLGRQVERGKEVTGVMVKDFDRDGYIQDQKGNFDDLIAQAKAKRKQALKQDQNQTDKATEGEAVVNGGADHLPIRSEELNGGDAVEPVLIEESPVKGSTSTPTFHDKILATDLELHGTSSRLLPWSSQHQQS